LFGRTRVRLQMRISIGHILLTLRSNTELPKFHFLKIRAKIWLTDYYFKKMANKT
jgi:hypothetical protein